MSHIWCPACGCDVEPLIRQQTRAEHQRLAVERRAMMQAVRRVRSLVNAMEAHAQAKADVLKSVPEIYRLWSDELLRELNERFPPKSARKADAVAGTVAEGKDSQRA